MHRFTKRNLEFSLSKPTSGQLPTPVGMTMMRIVSYLCLKQSGTKRRSVMALELEYVLGL